MKKNLLKNSVLNKEVKITQKLLISICFINLFFMFCFELAYNHMLYKDYSEVYSEVLQMENRVDKLIDLNLQLELYILKENKGGNQYDKLQ